MLYVTQPGLSDSKCQNPVLIQGRLRVDALDSTCHVARNRQEDAGHLGLSASLVTKGLSLP